MKTFFTLLVINTLLATAAVDCNKENKTSNNNNCFKGRLEIKGICLNYTIKVLEGNMDPSKIEANWADPSTGKVHQNVFALGNKCSFPNDIKEGDEFYFTITDKEDNDCMVCEAYRDKPFIKNNIIVSKSPCP